MPGVRLGHDLGNAASTESELVNTGRATQEWVSMGRLQWVWARKTRVWDRLSKNARICKAKLGFVNLWRLTC
jgi:hypothetical protein